MTKKFVFTFLVYIPCFAFGQTFADVYLNAYDLNKGLNLSYEMVYESYGKSKLVDKQSMKVEIIGNSVYTKSKEIDSYSFDSTSVLIDTKNRQIQLNVGIVLPTQKLPEPESIQQMVGLASRESKEKLDNSIEYTLFFENQQFSKITLVVSKEKGEFEKIVYVLAEEIASAKYVDKEPVARLEVLTKDLKKNIKAFSTPLSEFLKFDGERYSLQSKYSNYQFVTNYDVR